MHHRFKFSTEGLCKSLWEDVRPHISYTVDGAGDDALMFGGVLGVYVGCLGAVWRMSGGCLEDVWGVSGGMSDALMKMY